MARHVGLITRSVDHFNVAAAIAMGCLLSGAEIALCEALN